VDATDSLDGDDVSAVQGEPPPNYKFHKFQA
jgi:hypothetical protein